MLSRSPAALAATLALHAAAVAALLAYQPARSALLAAAPIMVEWLAAPKAEPAVQTPEPRRPKPVHRKARPVETATATTPTAPAEAPAPMAVPAPPPALPEAVALAPAPTPAPAAIVAPPIFNADYLQNPAPAYPALSRRLGEQGRVILRVLVNPNGSAGEVQLRTSSGSARLDESARVTVSHWKFVPAKRGSDPVPEWVLIPISFKLDG